MQSIWLCVGDAPAGTVRRYDFEKLVIRVLKGQGYIFFTVFVVLPFYVMVMTSFKSQAELLANPLDFSIDLGKANLFGSYTELFTKFNFGTYILNSAFVSVSTVLVTLLIAVPGAYAVARLRFRGRDAFARSILLIYMVPAIVLVLPLYAVFSQLELRNTILGLLIVYPATTIPVALYMLQGYFRGLPAEMEEAGLMDGLTRIGVIIKITLPLSLPALASVGLYVFMIAWNEFLFAFMFLDDPAIFTLPRGVRLAELLGASTRTDDGRGRHCHRADHGDLPLARTLHGPGPLRRCREGLSAVSDLDKAAEAVLRANDRGGYTVPTAGLYPYQWNWDSAFAALGFAEFDIDRAWRELETLAEGAWPNGMWPHILFRADDPDYFPGPSVWGAGTSVGAPIASSGVSQAAGGGHGGAHPLRARSGGGAGAPARALPQAAGLARLVPPRPPGAERRHPGHPSLGIRPRQFAGLGRRHGPGSDPGPRSLPAP